MFSPSDLQLFQSKGISVDQINNQIHSFEKGFPFLNVVKSAVYNDGIITLSDKDVLQLGEFYNSQKNNFTICKFVPASGAATRMFKSLYEYLENPEKTNNEAEKFISNIPLFAFYRDLVEIIEKKGLSIEKLPPRETINLLLSASGLNYGNLPKGLLKFHIYKDRSRVPVEEHLVEGAMYAGTGKNEVNVHFTLSPEHIQPFKELIDAVADEYEKLYGVKFTISCSIQKPSTDTIAVDKNNQPFRAKDGSLVFRPGGHGALIENLNDLKSDIIFIKNIDNVVPDRLKKTTVDYKNALAGLLIKTQEKINEYLQYLSSEEATGNLKNQEIKDFIESNLGYIFPESFLDLPVEDKRGMLFHILNRPLRVCGMVKNSGEPGGGPFWVQKEDGSLSLQILESSQFDLHNEDQLKVFKSATHFNPVDLVIYTKEFTGSKFNLKRFTDPETGFISIKSKDGKELKALELPGLWNGAMANWNTLFVEVPLITFNPVKTILDLLRDEHR
jgi:hypothetical protein